MQRVEPKRVARIVPSHGKGQLLALKKNQRVGGRQKGTPNKTTRLLKDAILMAATLEGADGKGRDGLVGYLRTLAHDYPQSFTTLLSRVLPYVVQGDNDNPLEVVYKTPDEVKQRMRDIGLPVPKQLLN